VEVDDDTEHVVVLVQQLLVGLLDGLCPNHLRHGPPLVVFDCRVRSWCAGMKGLKE